MATRSTESAAVDTAYATLETAVLAWLAAGGSRRLMSRYIVSRLSAADQGMNAAFAHGIGNSELLRPRSLTLATADTLP